ncbi:hypothetical protein EP21_17210 [Escherichia coli]|nr:hypothetical protein ECOLIN_06515 [Escherichia coli Nissle 1917]EYB58123.1 hypothetical protein BU66_06180 [Escherichia coli]KIE66710.1 hypothetical protein EP21_17210 [Escherichia coli]
MVFYNALYLIVLFFSVDVLPRRCKERSELRGLVGCIYLFFNKYNWLCVFRWANVRQRKPGAEAGLYYAASLLTQVSLLENGRTWLDSWKSKESCCI